MILTVLLVIIHLLTSSKKAKNPKGQIKTIRHKSFKTYSAEQFISDLHNISWDFIDTSLTVEEAWVSFKETLISLID